MLFPEFHKNESNSMKPSKEFLLGLSSRLWRKPKDKVFVIGFHKTGTSSLGKALQLLGYRVCGSLKEGKEVLKDLNTDIEPLLKLAEELDLFSKFDAFQDTPWFLAYRALYEKYPNAKFILTYRDEKKWLASVQKHFGNGNFPYHQAIYGTLNSIEDADQYLGTYRNHNKEVVSYFKEHSGNLLLLDIMETEDKWKLLAPFLGVKKPKRAFPHANKASYRYGFWSRVKRRVKSVYYNE